MPTRDGYVELAGSVALAASDAVVTGQADLSERIKVSVVLRRRSPIAPHRARARLTPEQLAARHGACDDDIEKVGAFAASHSLTVVSASPERRTMLLSGTVGQFVRAFDTTIVSVDEGAVRFRATGSPIFLPVTLEGVVVAMLGLDDRPIARPHVQPAQPQDFLLTLSVDQIGALYDFPSDLSGKGRTIAILEFGGGYRTSDLETYFGEGNLSTRSIRWVSADGAGNEPAGSTDLATEEVALDIEVAERVAPRADIVVYFAPDNVKGWFDAASATLVKGRETSDVVSISWGNPEPLWQPMVMTALDDVFADVAALGITGLHLIRRSGFVGRSQGASRAVSRVQSARPGLRRHRARVRRNEHSRRGRLSSVFPPPP